LLENQPWRTIDDCKKAEIRGPFMGKKKKHIEEFRREGKQAMMGGLAEEVSQIKERQLGGKDKKLLNNRNERNAILERRGLRWKKRVQDIPED